MYKNWKEICEIPNMFLMWLIALLDITYDFDQAIAMKFPEYFTDELQTGPVPWSVMVMTAERNAAKDGNIEGAKNHLSVYNGIPEWIPILHFADDYAGSPIGAGASLIPPELMEALQKEEEIGKVYNWNGKKIVLVDSCDSLEWEFIPAETVALDK